MLKLYSILVFKLNVSFYFYLFSYNNLDFLLNS